MPAVSTGKRCHFRTSWGCFRGTTAAGTAFEAKFQDISASASEATPAHQVSLLPRRKCYMSSRPHCWPFCSAHQSIQRSHRPLHVCWLSWTRSRRQVAYLVSLMPNRNWSSQLPANSARCSSGLQNPSRCFLPLAPSSSPSLLPSSSPSCKTVRQQLSALKSLCCDLASTVSFSVAL